MPLTDKGRKIMAAMTKEYGAEKGKSVFYASINKGKLSGVHKKYKKLCSTIRRKGLQTNYR